jgi:hypothetical protein
VAGRGQGVTAAAHAHHDQGTQWPITSDVPAPEPGVDELAGLGQLRRDLVMALHGMMHAATSPAAVSQVLAELFGAALTVAPA